MSEDANRYPFNQTPLATVLLALADAIQKRRMDRAYWSENDPTTGKPRGGDSVIGVIDDEIAQYERMMNDLNGRVFVIASNTPLDTAMDTAMEVTELSDADTGAGEPF